MHPTSFCGSCSRTDIHFVSHLLVAMLCLGLASFHYVGFYSIHSRCATLPFLILGVFALQAQSNLLVTVCRDKTFIYLEPNSDDKVHVRSSPLLLPSVRSPSLQVSVALCDVAKSTPTVWSSLISFLKCYFSAGSAGHHQLWLTKDHVRCSDVADSARSHQALSHALHTTDTCGHNRTAYQAEP